LQAGAQDSVNSMLSFSKDGFKVSQIMMSDLKNNTQRIIIMYVQGKNVSANNMMLNFPELKNHYFPIRVVRRTINNNYKRIA
jgi:hypothetical protein